MLAVRSIPLLTYFPEEMGAAVRVTTHYPMILIFTIVIVDIKYNKQTSLEGDALDMY